ncbi:MAG: 4Fe-4S dicluster domain-containing protein [Bacteroidales bacterium]|nr:4Fe-4S dicluster domain-containing protein [Bacteroidales bacterium]
MNKYWKSKEEKQTETRVPGSQANRDKEDSSLEMLFSDSIISSGATRRDFLKLFGFSIASAAIAASCEQPVRKAIPYLIKPEEITPGKANYYASSYYDGNDYCSVLVKVRDGRPIKIEGNKLSSVTGGGTNARVQASVLSLYDESRYKSPTINGEIVSWEEADKEIINRLNIISDSGKEIILLSNTVISPSTKAAIDLFLKKYQTAKHIQYDAISASGILEANKATFSKEVVPSYFFDNAEIIVSFGADFLGTWLSPVEFTKQYAQTRSLTEGQKRISKHIQFETNLSLTGSNADERIPIKPSEEKTILANLYNNIAPAFGAKTFKSPECNYNTEVITRELIRHHAKALVISGSNDVQVQIIVNAINELLGSYGSTIDLDNPLQHKKGNDTDMHNFIESLENGNIGGVIFYGTNPVYDYPKSEIIEENLKNCDLLVSVSTEKNETSEACIINCPDSHYLESWNDFEIKPGKYSLCQPAIRSIFNTRQAQDSLLKWSGEKKEYIDFIKANWQKNIYPESRASDFFTFWNNSLHDGIFELKSINKSVVTSVPVNILESAFNFFEKSSDNIEIVLYEKMSIGSGKNANNPWLQEMPDPVTTAVWDNYICISPRQAKEKNLKTGDLAIINNRITIPVLIQPGQAYGTIAVALGYGRKSSGKVAEGVGQNIVSFYQMRNGVRFAYDTISSLEKAGTGYQIAKTQLHHSMEGRAIIREATIEEYLKNNNAGNEIHKEIEKHHRSLYKEHEFSGHHWGMTIDLNKCTGCSACVVACMSENNIPVVGKNEVLRAHEMHWIRIDRYYKGNEENPQTVRQPVMCQHCDDAPCENVCPVAATNHSNEGINQMAYNRCIGTRYCNNNCPYKVRRFNWFDYTKADAIENNTVDPAGMTLDLKRMVLNPDVTVRAKGVIEKCSFCVQRIQEKKLTAKLENRQLNDGDIETACQQACPAEAIVFGDMNDPESKVSKHLKDPRNYHLLEELHTLPSVGYLTRISNRKKET